MYEYERDINEAFLYTLISVPNINDDQVNFEQVPLVSWGYTVALSRYYCHYIFFISLYILLEYLCDKSYRTLDYQVFPQYSLELNGMLHKYEFLC